jgi:hypothetical protein
MEASEGITLRPDLAVNWNLPQCTLCTNHHPGTFVYPLDQPYIAIIFVNSSPCFIAQWSADQSQNSWLPSSADILCQGPTSDVQDSQDCFRQY